MDQHSKRAAAAAYKKRESIAGIYAVRCATTGETWIGHTPDVDSIGNRLWFTLRAGGHMNKALQAAWNRDGAAGFSLEPLEVVDADTLGFTADKVLRDKAHGWRT
jgi:hypothetical protein